MPDDGLNIAGRKWGGNRYAGRLSIPPHAHPLVRQLMRIINDQRACMQEVSERAGVHVDTVKQWRTQTNPYLPTFEAVLNVLGYELVIRPRRGE